MSKQSISLLTLSIAAVGAIAANRFVTPARDQAVADENTLGVATTAATDGEVLAVDVMGTAIVEAGAAVAAGATLKADASGKGDHLGDFRREGCGGTGCRRRGR